MRVLAEERRVRKAVGEGIGRATRDLYNRQESEPAPDSMMVLLGQLDTLDRRPG